MPSFDPQLILRDELAELKAYTPEAGSYAVRLDANEAPGPLPADIRKHLTEVASKTLWHKYPDSGVSQLKKTIAKMHGVKSSQVIVGVGSDEIITMLLTAATRLKSRAPAPTLLTTTPTFVMYRLSARIRGQRVMEVPLDQAWDLDERAMSKAIEMAAPNVIFIASPNNPTGTMVSPDRLERLIQQASSSLVVVDEAYVNYADRDQCYLLSRYENVAILRTLSKVGFAALRVGWMIGQESLIKELDKVRLPYNMPSLSQSLAHCVLGEHLDYIQKLSLDVRKERDRVALELARIAGVTVVPSQANFLWLQVSRPASEIHAALARKGVLVRSFHGRGGKMEHFLRVTIGTAEENDQFLAAMAEVI